MKDLRPGDLEHFTGTERWFKYPFIPNLTYTDGVQYMAEHGGAHWLIDEIALSQTMAEIKAEPFQVWTLTVQDNKGVLKCDDGNGRVIYEKQIDYTDFPLPNVRLYVVDDVILLPSEY